MIEQILAYCGPYQAANIDDLRGHKGEGFECVLLKGERVIGTATEWANDGPIRLDIPTESRDDLLAHAKAEHPDVQYEPEGIFMASLSISLRLADAPSISGSITPWSARASDRGPITAITL